MAIILFSLLFVFTPQSPSHFHELTWHKHFEKAQEEAMEQDKKILLVFSGSDWCKPCIRLKEEVFETDDFKAFAKDRWSLLNVDFPRRRRNQIPEQDQIHRNTIAEKYNPKGLFPRVLILDSEGKVIDDLVYKGGGVPSFISKFK